MRSTKKSLIMSTISLILCFAMLLGSTYAWFTDEVTSGVNRIVAGNLDIDLLMDKGSGYVSIAGGQGDIFKEADKAQNSNATLWEPGKTQLAKLAIENKGNLAVKYTAYIDVTDNGLASALECALITAKAPISTDNYNNWAAVKAALPAEAIHPVTAGRNTIATGVLDEIAQKGTQNERDYVLLAVHMKEEAGNEYQGKDAIIDVTIVATQKDAEADSFDNQYDANAFGYSPVEPIHENVETTGVKAETTDTLTFTSSGDVLGATLKKSSAEALFTEEDKADVSKDMLLNLKVDTTEKTEDSITFDLSLYKTITTSTGGVTTKGEETKVEETLATYLVAELQLPANLKEVAVKHSGNAMDKLDDANAIPTNENGGFYYENTTGKLTVKSKSFSPFTVNYHICVVKNYAELQAAITEGEPYIKFKNDITDVPNKNSVYVTCSTVINGNGYKLTHAGGESDGNYAVVEIGKDNVEVKFVNLTILNPKYRGICNCYENVDIEVENCTIDSWFNIVFRNDTPATGTAHSQNCTLTVSNSVLSLNQIYAGDSNGALCIQTSGKNQVITIKNTVFNTNATKPNAEGAIIGGSNYKWPNGTGSNMENCKFNLENCSINLFGDNTWFYYFDCDNETDTNSVIARNCNFAEMGGAALFTNPYAFNYPVEFEHCKFSMDVSTITETEGTYPTLLQFTQNSDGTWTVQPTQAN